MGHGVPESRDDRPIASSMSLLELCQKALEENIIVYLGTVCGKTHIAVLLIQAESLDKEASEEDMHLFAPTVALVQQDERKVCHRGFDFVKFADEILAEFASQNVHWIGRGVSIDVIMIYDTPLVGIGS
nr:endoribonuclease dicer like 4 [Quercus suber]